MQLNDLFTKTENGMDTMKNDILKRKLLMRKLMQQKYLLLMILPGLLWMLIFNYIPMYGISVAFRTYKITDTLFCAPWNWKLAGLTYFRQFFSDAQFMAVIRNTLGINVLRLLIGFPLPILFALLLNELKNARFKKIVQTVSYLPHFLSWVILGGIMITWLSESGFINDLLIKLGIQDKGVPFLAKREPVYFWSIAIISDVWKSLGWNSIIYLAAITSIDPSLYESATIDGAGRIQKMLYITVPCIQGTIAILFVLAVGGLMTSNFDQIMVLRNSLNRPASEVLDIFIYRMGITSQRFSYATAAGLFRSGVALFFLIAAEFVLRKIRGTSTI